MSYQGYGGYPGGGHRDVPGGAQQHGHYSGGGYGSTYGAQGAPAYGQSGGFVSVHPPPGADPEMWRWFNAVDQDHSGLIGPLELKTALMNGDYTQFDIDTIKMLMNIFDADRSGTIGFNEFVGLFKYIKEWQAVFRRFDRDGSGTIDHRELETALKELGFNLSPHAIALVFKKYDIKATVQQSYGGPPVGINFDRFVRACIVVKQIHETFIRLDTQRTGWIQIDYQTFVQTVLQLP